MKELAPIVLFVYNRPWHTLQTLEALSKNDLASESILFIFADGPKKNATEEDIKKIEETEKVAKRQKWCKETIFVKREQNVGLADNIVGGITSVLDDHDSVIVLEDDIVTTRGFLRFMNESLELYKNEGQVMHISGYMFPVNLSLPETFFYNQASCWGWATWKRAWKNYNESAAMLLDSIVKKNEVNHFNLDGSYNFFQHLKANAEGTLKTWAVKWHASVFLLNGLCLHPRTSLVNNIGMDNTGVNSGTESRFQTKTTDYIKVLPGPLKEDLLARKAVGKFYRSFEKKRPSMFHRIVGKFKSILKP